MTALYSARRAGQAETRFPLKVSPNFPLARSLREQSPGLGLSLWLAIRPQCGAGKPEKETSPC